MELDKAKLQEVVEKIAYQQTSEDQADDLFNKMGILNKYVQEQLTLTDVSGSADANYWSERCKHAENIYENCPCDPDITDKQIESINVYHNFIKENGSKHYR
mgnify:CR=1 FL=1